MNRLVHLLDRVLRPIYRQFVYVAAFFLIAICVLILTSVISRQLQANISGINEYAGFCMAAATFFALAHTFAEGRHIRVELFLGMVGPRMAYWLNVLCYTFASALTLYLTFFLFRLAHVSFILHEKSQGIDATPLWIPQSALMFGSGLFAISCLHGLARILAAPAQKTKEAKVDDYAEPYEARWGK